MLRFNSILPILLISLPPLLYGDTAVQIIMTKRAAVSISPIRLYADSTYTKTTETTFTEGEVFEIIGETVVEHLDNTQNQTFKWFKIRSMTGEIGWLFGDNLAVIAPEYLVDAPLRPFYKKPIKLDNGFEKSTAWVAGTEGHDVKVGQENPIYKECYLVLTNERGKSILLNTANLNETVRKDVQSIYFQDVTENKIADIILETTSLSAGRTQEERLLEIYSLKSGTLTKIFEERLTLDWAADVNAPSLSKFVEVEGSTIRIAYVDFMPCEKYSLGLPTDVRSKTQERCLEYTTYSFVWDNSKRQFRELYKPSRRTVQAVAVQTITLKNTPSVSATDLCRAQPDERLQVIKHFENLRLEKGKKRMETWLYVKHPSGICGYVPAQEIQFLNCEHADLLKSFYQNTPLMKQNWRSEAQFVSVR